MLISWLMHLVGADRAADLAGGRRRRRVPRGRKGCSGRTTDKTTRNVGRGGVGGETQTPTGINNDKHGRGKLAAILGEDAGREGRRLWNNLTMCVGCLMFSARARR